jgi:hypothetical protein
MMDEDTKIGPDRLVTLKEISEIIGLHPNTVTSYRSRSQMPPPDEQFGRTPLWYLSTIRRWRYAEVT